MYPIFTTDDVVYHFCVTLGRLLVVKWTAGFPLRRYCSSDQSEQDGRLARCTGAIPDACLTEAILAHWGRACRRAADHKTWLLEMRTGLVAKDGLYHPCRLLIV